MAHLPTLQNLNQDMAHLAIPAKPNQGTPEDT